MGAIAFQFGNQRMGYFLAIAQNIISLCGSLCLCGEKTNESTTETQRTQCWQVAPQAKKNRIYGRSHSKLKAYFYPLLLII